MGRILGGKEEDGRGRERDAVEGVERERRKGVLENADDEICEKKLKAGKMGATYISSKLPDQSGDGSDIPHLRHAQNGSCPAHKECHKG